jgi:hypothetical protein
LTTGEGHLEITPPNGCQIGSTIDYWKQNGNGGILQDSITSTSLHASTISSIAAGQEVDISKRDNWLWSIPSNPNSVYQDFLAIRYEGEVLEPIVESIELFVLANVVTPNNITTNVCSSTYPVADPAADVRISIRYKNSKGQAREFSEVFNINDFYQESSSFSTSDPWDAQVSKGNGVKGQYARWESKKWVLDNTAGTGVDQFTNPTSQVVIGTGLLELEYFTLQGLGYQYEPCSTNVIIKKEIEGTRINAKQSIILPNPKGGTWTLSVTIPTVSETTYTTASLAYNASAITVQTAIAALSNVGTANVVVTGSGSSESPFVIEFINDLAGIDVDEITTDGSALIDVSTYMVTSLREGRYNERQLIDVVFTSWQPFRMVFDGQQTIDIAYNASLNTRQAAFQSLTNTGVGNVLLTGMTSDRDADYVGPVYVDFIGSFINTNLPQLAIYSPESTNPYKVETISDGNQPAWTLQKVLIEAEGGTFTLTIDNPYNPTESYTTGPIDYNASATDVKTAVQAAPWASWGYDFITAIVKKSVNYANGIAVSREWTVEFTMEWPSGTIDRDGINVPVMEIDGTNLIGGDIAVAIISEGINAASVLTVSVVNANSGFYKLRIILDNVSVISEQIDWNATADEFKTALKHHPLLNDNNCEVVKVVPLEAGITAQYDVTIGGYGNIPLFVPDYVNTLLCVPDDYFNAVIDPPYQYPLPEQCELDLSCSTGHRISRPCAGGDDIVVSSCCDQTSVPDRLNVATYYRYERDLFDPTKNYTVGDLLAIKGLKRSEYSVYKQVNDRYVNISYNDNTVQGMRIIAVQNELNSENAINRIKNYIDSKMIVLPSRQV